MKTQIKFQKILTLVSLLLAALCIVYSFAFFTGGLAELYHYSGTSPDFDINAGEIYDFAQTFNTILLYLSIVYLVIVLLLYITKSNTRRNYYVSNYVATIAAAVYTAVFAIICLIMISLCLSMFLNDIDWDEYKRVSELERNGIKLSPYYSESTTMFTLGYVLFVVVLADAVAIVLNLVWKIRLMKGEKALLQDGLVKEVA